MNLQSYFESCLSKRKNLRLPSSLPHVSVRLSSPALCMQQCTQSTSQCPAQAALSNKSSFSLARYIFCFLLLLSRYSEPLPARHYQWHCCASVPHPGTAEEEKGHFRLLALSLYWLHWLWLFTRPWYFVFLYFKHLQWIKKTIVVLTSPTPVTLNMSWEVDLRDLRQHFSSKYF